MQFQQRIPALRDHQGESVRIFPATIFARELTRYLCTLLRYHISDIYRRKNKS